MPYQRQIPEIGIESLLDVIVNHLDAMLAFWDANQKCLFANNAYLTWFGISQKDMIGIYMKDLLGPLYAKNLPHIEAALRGEVRSFERDILLPGGKVRHTLATYTPYLHGGKVVGFIAHIVDVTRMKKLERKLREAKTTAEHLATHDFLTGLPNRVLLIDRIRQAIAMSKRSKYRYALISVDIDDFKTINDTYGHSTGDQFLREIAATLTSSLRTSDSVTRIGGDEFLILVCGMDSTDNIQLLAERILSNINKKILIDGIDITPSCSLGIACFGDNPDSPETLVKLSDKALYQAKALGKNRYVIASK